MLETLKVIGEVLLGLLGIALFIIPDPIGKAVEVWRLFRD
jgi:hypothetical protein